MSHRTLEHCDDADVAELESQQSDADATLEECLQRYEAALLVLFEAEQAFIAAQLEAIAAKLYLLIVLDYGTAPSIQGPRHVAPRAFASQCHRRSSRARAAT